MEKFYTKILGTFVFCEGPRPLTSVRDVLIDPATGKICAFEVNAGKNDVIVPIDVLKWDKFISINDADSIIDAEDVMAVNKVLEENIRVFKNKVFTKKDEYLGRVFDFTVDSVDFRLKSIYVSEGFLGLLRYRKRVISSKDIVEILADKIVVKQDRGVVKESSSRDVPIKNLAGA